MLWDVKDFALIESKFLLLSTHLAMGTFSSLCVSLMCLGCWSTSLVCICPLELWHTTLKWFCFPHACHILPNAGHCICMCAAPSTYSSLYLTLLPALLIAVCSLSWFTYPFVCSQSLLHFSFNQKNVMHSLCLLSLGPL